MPVDRSDRFRNARSLIESGIACCPHCCFC